MKEACFPRHLSHCPLPNGFLRGGRSLRCWLGLLCLAWGCAAPLAAPAAVQMFLRIGGQAATMGSTQTVPKLAGESTDTQYPKWIPVLSLSHGIGAPAGPAGSTNGVAQHSDVLFSKLVDATTPSLNILVNGVATGLVVSLPIDYVTVDFRLSGANPIVFYRLELQGVYLTGVSVSGGGDVPSESITLRYERIRWTYAPYSSGKAGPAVTKGWDVVKNAPF